MAITVNTAVGSFASLDARRIEGNRRRVRLQITFDASYPGGGYAVNAATFGLTSLDDVEVSGPTQLGRAVQYNATTGKIQLFVPAVGVAAAADMTAATDLHLDSVFVTGVGS